jgi:zinc transport system ATP-binding protein
MPCQNENNPVVFAEDLTIRKGPTLVLQEITFEVNRGEMVGIIGPNGGGKTTLLRTLLGLIKPSAGKSALLGHPSDRLGPVREKIGYIPQSRTYDHRFPISAGDVVRMGLYSSRTLLRPLKRSQKESCREMLDIVGALHLATHPFGDLSGGEQQRVLLARALVRRPALLLLDEPNTGLDPAAQQLFMEQLHRLQQSFGLTVLLVSHDITSLAACADRLLCINRSMHIHGEPQQVLQSPNLKKAYRCPYDLLERASACEEEPR